MNITARQRACNALVNAEAHKSRASAYIPSPARLCPMGTFALASAQATCITVQTVWSGVHQIRFVKDDTLVLVPCRAVIMITMPKKRVRAGLEDRVEKLIRRIRPATHSAALECWPTTPSSWTGLGPLSTKSPEQHFMSNLPCSIFL
eukprot:scaffold116024_cov18-Tisochrysis_lutea.AAC.1